MPSSCRSGGSALLDATQSVPTPLLLLSVAATALFGGIFLLHIVVRAFFGPIAAGHVAGTYLVRVLDATGRLLLMLSLPFALLRGGSRDELAGRSRRR